MNMKYLLTILAAAFVLTSCETVSPSGEAQRLTMDELTSSPGYAWFPAEMNVYTPSSAMVQAINNDYKAGQHKILVFVKPSCSCRGTQRLFPQIMKTITESTINLDDVEIWSMRTEGDGHPYEPENEISELPMVNVLFEDQIINSVNDGNYNEFNADTLIANALIP